MKSTLSSLQQQTREESFSIRAPIIDRYWFVSVQTRTSPRRSAHVFFFPSLFVLKILLHSAARYDSHCVPESSAKIIKAEHEVFISTKCAKNTHIYIITTKTPSDCLSQNVVIWKIHSSKAKLVQNRSTIIHACLRRSI